MMMGFGLISTILVVALIAYILGWRPQGGENFFDDSNNQRQTPIDILKQRYARGEIDQQEFEQMRKDLS